ncbi:MAG: DUF6513 domain-containing protein [Pirellulaceae bacterium]|nr:DUF6513 domain-containing protein [Pirellulaceae bacterium]MDG2103146.1 DUF6513 domain-containing protein [Pirellulaceae bacterium]
MGSHQFAGQSLLLVTGRLAEPALRRMLPQWQQQFDVRLSLQVMPITVAALMSPQWLAKHLEIPEDCDAIILPGYCAGDLRPLQELTDLPIHLGPRDVRQLAEFFGGKLDPPSLDSYSIDIIAEINHAPRLAIDDLIFQAESLKNDGANVIDIGCEPGTVWQEVGTVVRELVDRGLRISIDSLNPQEIAPAVENGASLVLSVNSSNRRAALDWGCEVVVIPDNPADWLQISETVEFLAAQDVPLRIDPILEPIGFGFAASLARYMEARKTWPTAEIMMGIGNLTELSDVDSSGINFLLLAICEELSIRSILTTQVINWARSSVKECDIARRMVHLAVQQKVPPKNMISDLVCLRDPKIRSINEADLQALAESIRDNNYRILAESRHVSESGERLIHLLGGGQHWRHEDAFELFQQLMDSEPRNLDPSHAFYLGYEMCKATIANQLGKNYEQDEALRWGHLTVEEISHRRLQRQKRKKT